MDKQNIFSAPGLPGAERNNASININSSNSNKRNSYSFTLSGVGLEQELNDYLKMKTAKGTGLTVSNYIRELINKDYKGMYSNCSNNNVMSGLVSNDITDTIVNTKINTDNILRVLSSMGNTGGVTYNNMGASTERMLQDIYSHVINLNCNANNNAAYDINAILTAISDKLSELDEIKRALSSITGVDTTANTIESINQISRLIESQNSKIDRLESKMEESFDLVISLLKNREVQGVDDDIEEPASDISMSEQDRIAALLSQDLEDDDE